MVHFGFRYNSPLTFTNYIKFSTKYFTPQFLGVFKVIISFLKTLLFTLGLSFITFICHYLVLRYGYNDVFNEFILKLKDLLANPETGEEAFMEFLETNDVLATMTTISLAVDSITTYIFFFIFISRSSFSFTYRLLLKNTHPRFVDQVVARFYKENKKEFNRIYFGLNWPILCLMLLGMGAGFTLAFLKFDNSNLIAPFIVGGGTLFAMFYYPFYLCNMEAIGEHFESRTKDMTIKLANEQLLLLKKQDEMMEKFKAEHAQDEDTKKDSEESN